jgi:uncharacterized protein
VTPETVTPETVPPETVPLETVPLETVPPETALVDTAPPETVSMWTRDGVRLDADVYRPISQPEDTESAAATYPVLLMRQPYGRAIASTVVYAHPSWYAAQGYIVVIQDVRGRGTSEGEFKLFATEIEDGYDAVQWAAALPGSTGQVGMYGFSYQGMTQLYAAIAQPPALVTLCPAMVGYDLYADWAYEGGAFCLQANQSWALQLSAETVRLRGQEADYLALAAAAKSPIEGVRSPHLDRLDPDSFYHDWLHHPQPDAYWHALSPSTQFDAVDLPMLHIGGWYDTFLRGTWNLYQTMARRSRHRQQLVMGPWAHLPWGRRVGIRDFGPTAATPCDRLQVRWFDHFLKGQDTGLLAEPPVQLFEMGSNVWRTLPCLAHAVPTRLYCASTGLAALRDDDGTLCPTPPATTGGDTWVHDPWRPVPACGGHAAVPSGPSDRSALDCRSDVLTYTTEPYRQALHLLGPLTAHLYCTASSPSFDLCATVSEVTGDGRVIHLTQGYTRVDSKETQTETRDGAIAPITVTLQPICVCIPVGHALRLSLSAACFPAYPVNDGTGANPGTARAIDHQIITLTLHTGTPHSSHIALPLTPWPA